MKRREKKKIEKVVGHKLSKDGRWFWDQVLKRTRKSPKPGRGRK